MQLFRVLTGGIILLGGLLWPRTLTSPGPLMRYQPKVIEAMLADACLEVVQDSSLFAEGWDTLAQPRFWRRAISLPPDSLLVNIAATREIVTTLSSLSWQLRGKRAQRQYEDSLKRALGMSRREELYFTIGRSHFYRLEALLHAVDEAVAVFEAEGVDPWYAQAILLVESPGRLQYSVDGAYGAFQLMAEVAREVGLVVNDSVDQRADFSLSARGAARLMARTCLPHARALCERYELPYQENELWFRLLTMHIYHAGARNVGRVLRKISPETGGQALITAMWQAKSRRFGNASQNYSQLILALLMEWNERLRRAGVLCPGEGGERPRILPASKAPPVILGP